MNKNRILALMLSSMMVTAALFVVLVGSDSSEAADWTECDKDDLEWKFEGNTLTIRGSGPMHNYELDGVEPADIPPWSNEVINIVIIESGVTHIGGDAFSGLPLEEVSIPNTVDSIGAYAFSDTNLESITIPDSVTYIGADAFFNCASLTNITIGSGITSEDDIDVDAFNCLWGNGPDNNGVEVTVKNATDLNIGDIFEDMLILSREWFDDYDEFPEHMGIEYKTSIKLQHRVIFVDDQDNVIKSEYVSAGDTVKKPSDPAKEATEKYTYTFDKWVDKTGSAFNFSTPINGVKTIKAVFTATEKTAPESGSDTPAVISVLPEAKDGTSTISSKENNAVTLEIDKNAAGENSVAVELKQGTIKFDSAAFSEAAGKTLTLEKVSASTLSEKQKEVVKDRPVFSISLGNSSVNFGNGKAEITVDYTLAPGESANGIVVYYIDSEGKLTKCNTTYENGKITFVTDHFSDYVVMYEAPAAPADPVKPVEPVEPADGSSGGNNIGLIIGIVVGVIAVIGIGVFVFVKMKK